MTLVNVLRRHLVAIAIIASCAGLAAIGIWRVGGSPGTNAAGTQSEKQRFQERIRNGVGSEIRFSKAKDSDDDIRASIESVAQFIHGRSNMIMSEDTKKELLKAESDTLSGKRPRISIDALTDSLTASAADRIGTLNDREVEAVSNTFRPTADGQLTLRMAGQVGQVSKDEFVKGAVEARELKQRGELESSIRPFFEMQVSDRINNLSDAMPGEFGRAKAEGVTPVQAMVIAYSVASDDSLADSQHDLARQVTEERMSRRLTRAEAKAQRLNSPTPYGRNGFFYAAPVSILFNQTTVHRLLNPGQGGKDK